MIVVEVLREDAVQMPFVEHDHVIQTFSAYGADDAFAVRILPGRRGCDQDFLDAHVFDALLEVVTVDAIAIADEKTRCFVVRESVDDLLGGPFGVGIRGDVEVNDLPPVMAEHDEDVQDAKRDCRNDEEVAGGDIGNVIGQKRSPSLRRRLPGRTMYLATVASATSWPNRSSSDRILGAPQVGFSRDMRRIRSRISRSMGGRPGFPALDFHRQYSLNPSMPSDDRFGLHDDQGGSPVRPEPGEPYPEDAVAVPQLRTFDGLLEDGNLLSQCEVLDGQVDLGNKHRPEKHQIAFKMPMFRPSSPRKSAILARRRAEWQMT